jgi:hypothetical protein
MSEHVAIRMQRAREEQPWWGITWHDVRRAIGIEDGPLSEGARAWLERDVARPRLTRMPLTRDNQAPSTRMPAEMGASCSFLRSREELTDGEGQEVPDVRQGHARGEVQVACGSR